MFAAVFLLLVTPYYQSVKLWGGFGHVPLEIPIANELAPSSYQSRMRWLWGGFGEALGRLWKLLANIWTTFRHFVSEVALSLETSSKFQFKK